MAQSFTKTIQTALFALQSIASNTVAISSPLSVATAIALSVYIHFGRRSATALTTGVTFRIEASSKSSGDGHWFPISQWLTNKATVGSEAVSGTCNAGQAVILMASTTGFVVGDIVFIDNSTIANSEWGRIKTVTTNTSITLQENLASAQTGSTVYAGAQMAPITLDVAAHKRVRVVVDASETGQAVAVEVEAITCDSIG
jgi:hypothetical protein